MSGEPAERDWETIGYIRHMLGELRAVADAQDCDMLCYLIEMAYMEARDIQLGRQPSEIGSGKRDKATRMSV
jgi:hypothetical protein